MPAMQLATTAPRAVATRTLGQYDVSPAHAVVAGIYMAATVAGAYHGYKRNRSIGWAIGWGLLAGAFPYITLPIAAAQGYGEPKEQ